MIQHKWINLTFAILPSRVPGQTEKRREENNRSGNSSISEPHLISAPPRAAASGAPGPGVHTRFRGADRRWRGPGSSAVSSASRSLLESRGSPAELMHFQREMCNPHACRHWKGSWIHFLNIQKGIEIDMKTYCFGFALFFWTALTTTIVKQIAD